MTDQTNSQAVATQQPKPRAPELYRRFGERYGVDPTAVGNILKATCFKTKGGPPSNEQMAALLIVADQYGLNPFTKEIYAFPDKQNGIVPVVGVDGWNRIAKQHPNYGHERYEMPPRSEWVQIDKDAALCPSEFTVIIIRSDGTEMAPVTEYLDEVYQPPFKLPNGHELKGPWQTHTKRMLRHKARIQAFREHFGFSGIYDQDEAERIVAADGFQYESEPEPTITAEQATELLELAASKATAEQAADMVAQNAEMLGFTGAITSMPIPVWQRLMDALREMSDVVDGEATEEQEPSPEPARRGRPPKITGDQLTTLAALAAELETEKGATEEQWRADMAGQTDGCQRFEDLTKAKAEKLIDRWQKSLAKGKQQAAD